MFESGKQYRVKRDIPHQTGSILKEGDVVIPCRDTSNPPSDDGMIHGHHDPELVMCWLPGGAATRGWFLSPDQVEPV